MKYNEITSKKYVLDAIREFNQIGEKEFLKKYGFGSSTKFDLLYDGNYYPPKAIIGVAYKYFSGKALTNAECKNSTELRKKYQKLEFEIVEKDSKIHQKIQNEINFRNVLWNQLLKYGNPNYIPASIINELNIFRGGRGIWYEKERTTNIIESGVTIGILHTGKHYADDITSDGVLYHYPETEIKGRDINEIEATKAAMNLKIPIFIVTHSDRDTKKRKVYRGYVEDCDDDTQIFYISFISNGSLLYSHPKDTATEIIQEEPFLLLEKTDPKYSLSTQRPGQTKFRFDVLTRYGKQCAVCQIAFSEMIIAAHLHPKSQKGSNDARNGLPLCANHHIAFDKHLFGINPETLSLCFYEKGPTKEDLGITIDNIKHLKNIPHVEALEYNWKLFIKKSSHKY